MFSERILKLAEECEKELLPVFAEIDNIAFKNTQKVMSIFAENRLSDRHFNSTCGYGYNDDGRDLCDKMFAQALGCEYGFARSQIISGTHALAIALYGLLRPNDTMLSVAGKPYDTLDNVIGLNGNSGEGSLADLGVKYSQIDLIDGKYLNLNAIKTALDTDKTIKIVFVQRSKGYGDRRTLTVAEINELYDLVHSYKDIFLVVDNCYGEFVEAEEPKGDLLVGSLIKNAGGGIAETGGYIVGSERAVELASYRLTVPGIGLEAGASMGATKPMIKGLFFAPHITAQAIKTAHFAAAMFEKLGFECNPSSQEKRSDIIQVIRLHNAENVLKFCAGIQSGSPVDSFVTPEGWEMPGYNDSVVMAAGAFTQGSSIELSADAPLREPYLVYLQGGLTYESGKLGILTAVSKMLGE
ncbi:MAG: methionine gamma-lyase family protein [Clostridia bacterium]|nr:methionine gamma-lyase family protein [Clostridia bacterium]MBR5278052.1 methionine gamma-lyase family protein [Clostridia bacterium]